ncbi:MAG: hypothetical protein OHK0012_15360 [Synechococcales cyanobacterium]
MANQLDLTHLTNQQLTKLSWDLKGTPAVQAVYDELGSRPPLIQIHPSDPEWAAKTQQALKEALGSS